MTIDVGYAHLRLVDGREIDFVDVPGHDRFIGNMLVGAAEIDAAMVVVAADDGPRPQTLEHLEILDGLGIAAGLAVITKGDLLAPGDPRWITLRSQLAALLGQTSLAGAPILAASSVSGEGIDAIRDQLEVIARRLQLPAVNPDSPVRLSIDRSFTVRGRGLVVTGTLRGGHIEPGRILRLEPGGVPVRVREVQVHSSKVDAVAGGGRVALNLVGAGLTTARRGAVLTDDPAVIVATRLLVSFRKPAMLGAAAAGRSFKDGAGLIFHVGTDHVPASLVQGGRTVLEAGDGSRVGLLKLQRPVAVAMGDRFLLRWPSPPSNAAAGRILDPRPPGSVALRGDRRLALIDLADAAGVEQMLEPLVRIHGALPVIRADVQGAASPSGTRRIGEQLVSANTAATILVELDRAIDLLEPGQALGRAIGALRPQLVQVIQRVLRLSRTDSTALAEAIFREGSTLARLQGLSRASVVDDRALDWPPEIVAAMGRVEESLASRTPPPLAEAAAAAGCPPGALHELEATGRIIRVDETLAYSRDTYATLEGIALILAGTGPLTPAAYRDATGTSRRYAIAMLEDMDRKAYLRRTPRGHVLGPRAPRATAPAEGTPAV